VKHSPKFNSFCLLTHARARTGPTLDCHRAPVVIACQFEWVGDNPRVGVIDHATLP